jgi:VanZ family protein
VSRGSCTTGTADQGVALIKSRRLAGALTVLYVLVVAFIVFAPTADFPSASVVYIWRGLQALGAPDYVTPGAVEFGTNVLLFVPLSILGSTFRPRWRLAAWTTAGVVGTAFIELSQALLLPGRSPELQDMVANTLGAVLGYLLMMPARRRRARGREQQRGP